MIKRALIIFVRNPEWGKVKTRLAAVLGNDKTLEIYKKLLQHTCVIVRDLPATKFVYYVDWINPDDLWNGFEKQVQAAGDLGQRMQAAFEKLFSEGFQQVCIIGSDCAELTTDILSRAFTQLDHNDIAIGPACDGGYYLLGMKEAHSQLFRNKRWSSSVVYEETIADIQNLQLSCAMLPLLNDIDVVADLPFHWLDV